jgi:hypothetical protein
MKYATLHLRARRVPAATTTALATSACAWLAWVLASDTRQVGTPLAAVAVMLACVAASATLGGDDEALDRTAAFSWPQLRAVHLLVAFTLLTGLFLLTLVTPAQFGPVAFVVRDVGGLLGLCALGATVLGAQRAWFAPVFLSVIAVIWGAPSTNRGVQVLLWMTQPVGTTASTLTAIALAAVGFGVHVRGRTSLPRTESL